MKKLMLGVFLLLLLIFIYLVGDFALFLFSVPDVNNNKEFSFSIKPGTGLKKISFILNEENFIKDETKFYLLARFLGYSKKIKVGEFLLKKNMTPLQILDILVKGRSIEYVFTVQEGLNIFEIADLFEKKDLGTKDDFLALVNNPIFIKKLLAEKLPSLEGFLFPETYYITKFTGAKKLIRTMVERFLDVYSDVSPYAQKIGLSRLEVVTLASIIEKETGAPNERPIISSVFHNRLKKEMRLQTDPTVLYGIWISGNVDVINITKKHLQTRNEYNTYTFKGLPRGPIANPGKASLFAAVKPKKTDYLYFVSKNNGTHVFSETYKKHIEAVKKFQMNPRARRGKSWRNLYEKEE